MRIVSIQSSLTHKRITVCRNDSPRIVRGAAPPGDIMLIILSVVTLSAALEAAGGLNYLVSIAEKIIRKNPKNITIVAPLLSFVLC